MNGTFEEENAQKQTIFTSTGEKLLHHPEAIEDLRQKKNHPIVLHIMPTEVCNLNCVFCSVAQRGKEGKLHKDLQLDQIRFVVESLKKKGLKSVILSGGGDPTLYPHINELLEYIHSEGLEIGMITNGIALAKNIKTENLDLLTWIRISANSLDYVKDITIPEIDAEKTTLGFSYIMNPKTTDDVLLKIKAKIGGLVNIPVSYVRLLPDCNLPTDQLEAEHQKLHKIAEKLGDPFFHQYKIHERPQECHLGRVHPVLYTDGNIYPCDSLVLNAPKDDKKFDNKFALCDWTEVNEFYNKEIDGSLIDTNNCPNCVFTKQNNLLRDIIDPQGNIQAIIGGDIKHKNFI